MKKLIRIMISTFLVFHGIPASGLTFKGISKDVIGEIFHAYSLPGETLGDVGRRFDIGHIEMQEANPQIKNFRLSSGTQVTIPAQFILPPGERNGVVLNLAELRLYYFDPQKDLIKTFPVGIGQMGWSTPLTKARITEKKKDPTWTPPSSIRRKYARLGRTLPSVVPAGPNNPLGQYALRLSVPGFLIHGTNHPETVGLRSSHGCLRMYPEDIKELYDTVPVKTQVSIIHAPYKVAIKNNRLYLEAHEPLNGTKYQNVGTNLKQLVQNLNLNERDIDWTELENAAAESYGYPLIIY